MVAIATKAAAVATTHLLGDALSFALALGIFLVGGSVRLRALSLGEVSGSDSFAGKALTTCDSTSK